MKAMVRTKQAVEQFTDEEVTLIKSQISRSYGNQVSDADLKVFLYVAAKRRLNPLQGQIHLVPRFDKAKNKWVCAHQTSVDGLRAIASRTGAYAGNEDAIFDSELQPKKATVTVYRLVGGVRCPFTASARWEQYFPGDKQGFMWRKMPHVMLGKCAEALALRKAFPEETGGLFGDEEMQEAEGHTIAPTVAHTEIPESVVEDLDAEYSQIVEQEEEPKADDLDERRIGIMNRLIGKGKLFGAKVGDAKQFVKSLVGKDIMAMNEEECKKVEEAIAAKIGTPEAL